MQSIVDVEPTTIDSDYDLAFRSVGSAKRGLVLVLTDLVDPAAARSLLAAIPVLVKRHAVVVASVSTQEGETVAAGLNAPTFVTIIDLDPDADDEAEEEIPVQIVRFERGRGAATIARRYRGPRCGILVPWKRHSSGGREVPPS